jgi:hypothetical protein
MTKDEILSMAREAGLAVNPPSWGYTEHYHFAGFEQTMARFAALVAEKEREAILSLEDSAGNVYAEAIRARGNK